MDRISLSIIGINNQVTHNCPGGSYAFASFRGAGIVLCALFSLVFLSGCATQKTRMIEATAYCGCSICCSWERGSWSYLKLDFWNRYVSAGRAAGRDYTGKTAANTDPVEPQPGLVSFDSLSRPWMIPLRTVFPWLWFSHDGTIAADTAYYPFGTRMFVPGWGWGVVADRGGAIKGPDRIDLFFESHHDAMLWGRRRVQVIIDE